MTDDVHRTSERIYRAVKQLLLSGGLPPGERLDAAELAKGYFASITPVRAALYRLTGEGLVDGRAGEGFHVPSITELSLRDLYAWNGQVLQLALRLSLAAAGGERGSLALASAKSAVATDHLFSALGQASDNEYCAAAISRLNDQLHLARQLEGQLFADLDDEGRNLANIMADGRPAAIRQALARYHRRRVRAAAAIVRLMRGTSASWQGAG